MSLIQQALDTIEFQAPSAKDIRYTFEGHPVPRTTEILNRMIHNDGLMYWANSLGFRGIKYSEALNEAANIGTIAHSAIEHFLTEKLETVDNIPFLGFLSWYSIILDNSGTIKPIYIEHKMACRWFGGTLDALMEINGRLFLMDFKTSNHVTFSYFLQLAAYRYMLYVNEGINIDGVIVLQLDKKEPGFNEYLLDFMNQEHLKFMQDCEEALLSLVYSFYQIAKVEKQFKYIF